MPAMKRPYILVTGLGRSGFAMACFLNRQGHRVVVTDQDPTLAPRAADLAALGIQTEIGFHRQSTFDQAELIIASPGISLEMPFLKQAARNGVPIRGELDLAAAHIGAPLVAVTGTNGKTTVTTLIDQMLRHAYPAVFTGGNIGIPLAAYFDTDRGADVVVAEVSSFQLDTAKGFKPHVAILLNISPDHMDRYSGAGAYAEAKWRIFSHQDPTDAAIVGSSLTRKKNALAKIKARLFLIRIHPETAPENGALLKKDHVTFYRGGNPCATLDLSRSPLRGSHNRENITAAALAAHLMGVKTRDIQQEIQQFTGLGHRMEYVATVHGIAYYNDSKATNPDAVIKAVLCFDPVVLIMGGQDKNMDFSALRPPLEGRVSQLILMGPAAKKIQTALAGLCPVTRVKTMEEAVRTAHDLAGINETVLLSPACASFDRYQSYAHRGDDFKRQVRRLLEAP